MWGNQYGQWLQQWSAKNNRPVVWADGDSSGMVLDPVVNQVGGTYITTAMSQQFEAHFRNKSLSFADLYAAVDDALKFELPTWYKKSICEAHEAAGESVMGYNLAGECVYWTPSPLPLAFECLNDGTCAQSMGGSHQTFFDKSTCEANCGQGSWACVLNQQNPGCAGANAVMCVPSSGGMCSGLDTCEAECGKQHERNRTFTTKSRSRMHDR